MLPDDIIPEFTGKKIISLHVGKDTAGYDYIVLLCEGNKVLVAREGGQAGFLRIQINGKDYPIE